MRADSVLSHLMILMTTKSTNIPLSNKPERLLHINFFCKPWESQSIHLLYHDTTPTRVSEDFRNFVRLRNGVQGCNKRTRMSCLEWLKTGSNGFSLGCMDRLRIDLENPFGKSSDRSKASRMFRGALVGTLTRFYILMKDLEEAGFPIP